MTLAPGFSVMGFDALPLDVATPLTVTDAVASASVGVTVMMLMLLTIFIA